MHALDMHKRIGPGLLEVPEESNTRGLREVGCLPATKPGLVPIDGGRGSTEIKEGLLSDGLGFVLLADADPVRTYPDSEGWRKALAGSTVVSISGFENESTRLADLVIPAETWAEKEGTVTHPEGRLQRLRRNVPLPDGMIAGWRFLDAVAAELGAGLDAEAPADVFDAVVEEVPFYAGLTYEEIGGTGVRWGDRAPGQAWTPVTAGRHEVAAPHHERDGEGLLLGTHRDLWAADVTNRNPALRFLMPKQKLELAAKDAESLQLAPRRRGDGLGQRLQPRRDGRDPGADARGRRLPDRGDRRVERQPAHERHLAADRGGEAVSLPLAEVNYVEATWVMVVKSIIIFLGVFLIVPVLTVVERKLIGRFQNRYGPNRVGPVGLAQPLADIVKLAGKEMFRPDAAVPFLYAIAPAIVIFSGIITLAILPFGNVQDGIGLYGIDVSIGVLYFFAFSSISFYGLLLAGWASGSKYSFLGAMRSAAQLISYEVSMGLALLGVVMMTGSLSLTSVVDAQGSIWNIVPQFVGFLIFMIAGFAETNRAPFDLPEADAELVQGYMTEYGGMRFGSYLLAEYLEMFVVSGIAVTFFLGGWMGPGPGWLDPVWMVVKTLSLVAFFIWIRATLPRLRYDQLMSLGWKVMLPLATLNILATAVIVTVS